MGALGRKLLIKKGGEVLAGLRNVSIAWSGGAIDITDGELSGARALLDESDVEQFDLQVEGIIKKAVFRRLILGAGKSRMLNDITIEWPPEDGSPPETLSGNFRLSNYEEGAPYNDAITFSATLQSSSTGTFVGEIKEPWGCGPGGGDPGGGGGGIDFLHAIEWVGGDMGPPYVVVDPGGEVYFDYPYGVPEQYIMSQGNMLAAGWRPGVTIVFNFTLTRNVLEEGSRKPHVRLRLYDPNEFGYWGAGISAEDPPQLGVPYTWEVTMPESDEYLITPDSYMIVWFSDDTYAEAAFTLHSVTILDD